MTDFLHALVQYLFEFWPIRIVDAAHQGVLLNGDGTATTLSPGLHWFVPGYQRVETWSVAYQEVDCELQTVETEDNVAVTFGANVGFIVDDAARLWTAVHDVGTTLERAARGYFGQLVASYSYEDLHETREDVVEQAQEALAELTKDWGITIVRVRFTDFVRTRNYRLFNGHAGAATHNILEY